MRTILERGVLGVLEARTLFFNGRLDEYLDELMELDEFVSRVLEDRKSSYKAPEKVNAPKGFLAYRYYNVSRKRHGYVIGLEKLTSSTLNALEGLVKNIREEDPEAKEIVVVIYAKPSDKNLNELKTILARSKMDRTILHGGEYPMFNLMRHVYVPIHIILNEEEKAEVFRKYDIDLTEGTRFPLIKESDPVAKLIGARRGDLILILRPSETAKRATYYRYVVRPEEISV